MQKGRVEEKTCAKRGYKKEDQKPLSARGKKEKIIADHGTRNCPLKPCSYPELFSLGKYVFQYSTNRQKGCKREEEVGTASSIAIWTQKTSRP
jgi:hypothetical protein